ncbi:16S rRNA (guanine(966)-N(2))-methyltransferase RsmD [Catenovulum sediminis]|uniref:16S rRNA (guanine(966)-N(2))-methyltransferase RsmD n=1 Tax=Catenovulum sediminis TaxID=1740262 RepID=UPI00117C7565|nr:16S rRNA (guanine(966)-N(2))-methyltransferase RsmD [Catenovulum sediminis]
MVSRPTRRQNKANMKPALSAGFVRIIAGQWKGRKLSVADLPGLRPTTDRVKETLFNWLMFEVAESRVLDCYAGSGSLSFEALSRGARYATLLEKSKAAAVSLKANLSNLKGLPPSAAAVVQTDTLDYLQTHNSAESYDIIFIDPPFRQGLLEKTCRLVTENNYIAKQGLIYLEYENELAQLTLPSSWKLLKSQTAGQSKYQLYQYNDEH